MNFDKGIGFSNEETSSTFPSVSFSKTIFSAIPHQGANHPLMSKQFHLTSFILSLFKILQLSDSTFLSPAIKFVWGLLFRSPAHCPFTTIHVIFLNDFLQYATSTFPIMHLFCPPPPPPHLSPYQKKRKMYIIIVFNVS